MLAFAAALAGCGSSPPPAIANRAEPQATSSASPRDQVIAVTGHVILLKMATFPEYREVMSSALALPGVTAATPFTFTEMKVSSARHAQAVPVAMKGIEPPEGGKSLSPFLIQGALHALDDPKVPAVILGDALARTLDVRVGDDITVQLSPDEPGAGWAAAAWNGTTPPPHSPHTFRVAGILRLGLEDYDGRFACANLAVMQGVIGRGDVVTGVQVRVKDPDRAGELASKLVEHLGGPPYQAMDWYALNREFLEAEQPAR